MMQQTEYRDAIDRSLSGLRFTEAMKDRVRTRMTAGGETASRPVQKTFPRAFAAVAVCAALLVTALAAGPTLWELIQTHLGPQAPYAVSLEGEAVDQGVALKPAAALADQNMIRIYFTLKDLEGDRLDETCAVLFRGDNAPVINGGEPLEAVGYDPETGEAVFCQTFYAQDCPDRMTLAVSELRPGNRPFQLRLTGAELDEWIPQETLESAQDREGRTYLLPDQNPLALSGEQVDLPAGETSAVAISSMGFAADGQLHVRFDVDEGATPMGTWSLSLSGGLAALAPTPVEGGLDFAFPPEVITRDDLADAFFLLASGAYSTQGGSLAGDWSVTIPLEPVERRALTAPDGPGTEAWLSPLGLSLAFRYGEEGYFAPELVTATLADGTQAEASLLQQTGSGTEGRAMWAFDAPIELDDVVSVSLNGETLTYAQ